MSQLTAPVITAEVITAASSYAVRVFGLYDTDAAGWQVRVSTVRGYGLAEEVLPAAGVAVVGFLRPRLTYYVQARAIGDGENFTDSPWSNIAEVTTGGEVDETIPVPALDPGTANFSQIPFYGFAKEWGVRWQFAAAEDMVDSAPIVPGGVNNSGQALVRGLRPGQTYYLRACYVGAGKNVGGWSEVTAVSTDATTSAAVVTSTADSGTGSLRAVVQAARAGTLITFDPSLSGAVITLGSFLSISGRFVIDGSDLEIPVTIKNNGGLRSGSNAHIYGVIVESGASADTYGHYVDCTLVNTRYANSICRCAVSGKCDVSSGQIDSVWLEGAVVSSFSAVSSMCVNIGCVGLGWFTSAQLYLSTVARKPSGSIATSTRLVECDIVQNTVSAGAVGGPSQVYFSRCADNTVTSSNSAMISLSGSGLCRDSIFFNNTSAGSAPCGGVASGNYTRCVILTDDQAHNAVDSAATATLTDCLVMGKCASARAVFANCTIDLATAGTARNCLLGPGSTVSGDHNLVWSDDPDDPAYFGKVFVDLNSGDYHLRAGSPAAGAGDNSIVADGDTDLDGVPRVIGGNVDLGCYTMVGYAVETPSFEVTPRSGGVAAVRFTLPVGAGELLLCYADNQDFNHAQTIRASGDFNVAGLDGTVYFRAKALGLENLTLDSDWTEVQTALFEDPPTLFKWSARVDLSGEGRTRQNVMIRAKIADAETGAILPPTLVDSASFTCWRLGADGGRAAVDGFSDLEVSNACFADDAADGFNFKFIPDQTSTMMLADPGRYVMSVAVTLASGNPFDVVSDIITVY